MSHKRWVGVNTEAQHLPTGPEKLRAVIKELDVAKNERYAKVWNEKRKRWDTWCNIFVTDVTDAMGVAPTHWMSKDGSPSKIGGEVEMNANRLVRWLAEHGETYGWSEQDRLSAFDAAARGHLVLVVYDSGSDKSSGHVAVLLPEGTIAQAGARNFVGETIAAGFGALPIKFYVQTRVGLHSLGEAK